MAILLILELEDNVLDNFSATTPEQKLADMLEDIKDILVNVGEYTVLSVKKNYIPREENDGRG